MSLVDARATTTTVGASAAAATAHDDNNDDSDHARQQQQQQLSLQEQLKLIQLCFGEHEFAVMLLDNDNDDNDDDRKTKKTRSDGHDVDDGAGSDDTGGVRVYDFDAAAFVRSKRASGVALGVLQRDLDVFVRHTRATLEQLVNSELYVAFVQVASRLVGMQAELQALQRPLRVAAEEVDDACAQLTSLCDRVDAKLQHAVDAELERRFDLQMVQLLLLYDKLTRLLQQQQQQPQEQQHNGDSKSSMQPRVWRHRATTTLSTATLLLQRLRALAAALPHLPQRHDERSEACALARRANDALLDWLQHTLCLLCAHVLAHNNNNNNDDDMHNTTNATCAHASSCVGQPQPQQQLRRVAALYARLDAVDALATTLRTRVLRPYLQDTLSWRAASQARQSADAHVRVLDRVAAALQTHVLPLMHTIRDGVAHDDDVDDDDNNNMHATPCALPQAQPLYAMAEVVWPALCEALTMRLPTLHDMSATDAFRRKYAAAHRLLAVVARGCASRDEWHALQQRADVVQWRGKWSSDVYAALRIADRDATLTAACRALTTTHDVKQLYNNDNNDDNDNKERRVYMLRVVTLLAQQVQWLFADDVYLRVCTAAFLRHVARSTAAVLDALLQHLQYILQQQQQPSPQQTTTTAAASAGSETQAAAATTTTTTTRGDDSDDDATECARARFYSAVVHDVNAFATALTTTTLHDVVRQRVLADDDDDDSSNNGDDNDSSRSNNDVRAVDAVVYYVRNTLCARALQQAESLLCSHLVDACTALLHGVRSVRSTYSHTRKALPSAPSWYVAAAAAPLVRFARAAVATTTTTHAHDDSSNDSDHTALSSSSPLQTLMQRAVDAVVTQFVCIAHDTLLAAKRTEESWEKLRRRKDNNNGGGGGATSVARSSSPTAADDGDDATRRRDEVAGGHGTSGSGMRVTAETASDRDKMVLQLYVDAHALLRALHDAPPLAVVPSDAVAQRLATLLRRAEWLHGARIDEPRDIDDTTV